MIVCRHELGVEPPIPWQFQHWLQLLHSLLAESWRLEDARSFYLARRFVLLRLLEEGRTLDSPN